MLQTGSHRNQVTKHGAGLWSLRVTFSSFLSVTLVHLLLILLSFFFLVMGTKPTVLHLMVRCSTPKLNLLLLVYSIAMVSVNVNDQFDNILGSLEAPKEHL